MHAASAGQFEMPRVSAALHRVQASIRLSAEIMARIGIVGEILNLNLARAS
jgi:hypothetical protein